MSTSSSPYFSVSDARNACGSILQSSSGFVAFDVSGKIVGQFRTLREAVRALPAGSSA